MGNLIKELNKILLKKNITKADLARTLGVTPQFINGIYNGNKKLNVNHIEILRKQLELDKKDIIKLKKCIFVTDRELEEWIDSIENKAFENTLIEDNHNLFLLFEKIAKIKNKNLREDILDYINFKLKHRLVKEDDN